MGVLDYFKPVDTMTADEVREFLKDKKPDEYNLILSAHKYSYYRSVRALAEEAGTGISRGAFRRRFSCQRRNL